MDSARSRRSSLSSFHNRLSSAAGGSTARGDNQTGRDEQQPAVQDDAIKSVYEIIFSP